MPSGSRGGIPRVDFSLGDRENASIQKCREAGALVAQWMRNRNVARAVIDMAAVQSASHDEGIIAFAEGLALGDYAFDRHKSNQRSGSGLGAVLSCKRVQPALRKNLQKAVAVCTAVNNARDWAHEPPNEINPVTLATRCRKLARSTGLKCTVIDDKQLARMKANGIVQVGIGSKTPSRLIILEHKGARANARPVVLVGKAITFDTGGYSLKDTKGIVGMKYDKCGGMAVVGALHAAAALKCRQPVIGVIAAAENMISSKAYRPNDIIRMLNGKTVEIISTDAEGRMVLADALTYAERKFKPRAMIDLATLTGGVVVALGGTRAGLMTPSDDLADALMASGDATHERLWRLPLDDDYLDLIKGDDSDLKNSGGRSAHAIIGGMFLKQFVTDKTPWAHLDIAGVGDIEKDTPLCPKGGTGFGIRLLIDYLENLK
jgi:leucyl aminopeptidase